MDRRRREGWNRERLAKYILGKLSFIAAPDSIGDDYGSDVSGFFVREDHTKRFRLVPVLPYAIQIKAKHEPKWVHLHFDALAKGTIPFYYGILDTKKKQLNVYSTLYLQLLFATLGRMQACDRIALGNLQVKTRLGRKPRISQGAKVRLKSQSQQLPPLVVKSDVATFELYHVCTLDIESYYASLAAKEWMLDATQYLKTIESAKAGEFIFYGPKGVLQSIGSGSLWWAINRWVHASSLMLDVVHARPNGNESHDMILKIADTAEHVLDFASQLSRGIEYDEAINVALFDHWTENIAAISETAILSGDAPK